MFSGFQEFWVYFLLCLNKSLIIRCDQTNSLHDTVLIYEVVHWKFFVPGALCELSFIISRRVLKKTLTTQCDQTNSLHDTRVSRIYEVAHWNFFRSSKTSDCVFYYISKSSQWDQTNSLHDTRISSIYVAHWKKIGVLNAFSFISWRVPKETFMTQSEQTNSFINIKSCPTENTSQWIFNKTLIVIWCFYKAIRLSGINFKYIVFIRYFFYLSLEIFLLVSLQTTSDNIWKSIFPIFF